MSEMSHFEQNINFPYFHHILIGKILEKLNVQL